jgi:predicted PhzF superfamily epimerase YddE/YHI9
MPTPIIQVDAFTRVPFTGNPAAVCLMDSPAPDAWMQSVAVEMNLSETAFLLPEAEGLKPNDSQPSGYRLRWFTPRKEVRLCGHATLAAAHVLWETGALPRDAQARFFTLSGLLTADLRGSWIEMDFPARFHTACQPPDRLFEALGTAPVSVRCREQTYLIELESEAAVRALAPDFALLGKLPVRSLIVTALSSNPDYDFVSRYFAPAIGVNEDPVTGAAHCALTPYWSAKLGKMEMRAYQASARGGELRVRLLDQRVLLCGQAVTVMTGELA